MIIDTFDICQDKQAVHQTLTRLLKSELSFYLELELKNYDLNQTGEPLSLEQLSDHLRYFIENIDPLNDVDKINSLDYFFRHLDTDWQQVF